MYAISAELYKQGGPEAGAGPAGPQAESDGAADKDPGVVDAEFHEVKDKQG